MRGLFHESRDFAWAQGALFAIHHHQSETPDLAYRRLPMPWLCLTLRLSGRGQWRRSNEIAWRDMPTLALRGLFDTWSEGCDLDAGSQEYLVALIEPWAAKLFFPFAAAATRNSIVEISLPDSLYAHLHACDDAGEKCALLENWLKQKFRPDLRAAHKIIGVFQHLQNAGGATSMADLSRATSRSERRVNEAVSLACGMGPKRYASLLRFSLALSALHAEPWRVAAAPNLFADYYDQSHLIREFRRFAGVTPGFYQATKRRDPRTIFTI